ncbi:hypothetical protein ACK3OH_004524 [Salmonella enterica]
MAVLSTAALIFFVAVGFWAFDVFSFREAVKLSVLYTGLGFVVFEVLYVLLSVVVLITVLSVSSPVGRLYAAGFMLFLMTLVISKLSASIPDSERLFGVAVNELVSFSMLVPVVMFMAYVLWFFTVGKYKNYDY